VPACTIEGNIDSIVEYVREQLSAAYLGTTCNDKTVVWAGEEAKGLIDKTIDLYLKENKNV